ncbi:hypothetical protein CARUB_v100247331mg, partial [Capsella rubella]
MKSVSNSFDASQLWINPSFPEVDVFTQSLPEDGLALTVCDTVPRLDFVNVGKDDSCLEHPRRIIAEMLGCFEKVRFLCTIYAIDTDWTSHYFSCCNCNKKVTPIHQGGVNKDASKSKPKFWCDICKIVVTRVVAKYFLYAKVMDSTGETKCLLFDQCASDIIGASSTNFLGVSLHEIDNPKDLPNQVKIVLALHQNELFV